MSTTETFLELFAEWMAEGLSYQQFSRLNRLARIEGVELSEMVQEWNS